MPPLPRTLPFLAFALFAAPSAHALVIQTFSNATDSRFTSDTTYTSWNASPTRNATWRLSSFDTSGIGWHVTATASDSQQGFALVTAKHFVTAFHVNPTVGDTVRFLGSNDTLYNHTIASLTRIGTTDLVLGTLSTAVNTSFVKALPIAMLGADANYLGDPLHLYGRGSTGNFTSPRAGIGFVAAIEDQTVSGSTGRTVRSDVLGASPAVGSAYFQAGDSGNPMLMSIGGTLSLVGVNWAVNTTDSLAEKSWATFLPAYYSDLQTLVAADGFSLTAIPEPASTTFLLGLAALTATARRRRKHAATP